MKISREKCPAACNQEASHKHGSIILVSGSHPTLLF